jgi:L-alanine-DL-glutamate epimerase-like enolase superfamily enzyme
LLSEDVAEGLAYTNGEVSLPQSPGLGITSQLFH